MKFSNQIFIYKNVNKKLEVKTVKGIELPINILVIVAVAIIVLLGVIALFYSSWFSGTGTISLEAAKGTACNAAVREGCTVDTDTLVVDPPYQGVSTLQDLCEGFYSVTAADQTTCKNRVCGMQCT